MKLDVGLTGDPVKAVQALPKLMRNAVMRAALRDCALYGQSRILRQFKTKGQLYGEKWPETHWIWALIRSNVSKSKGAIVNADDAKAVPRPSLEDQGQLRMSFQSAGAIEATAKHGIIGSAIPYAIYHQLGKPHTFTFTPDIEQRLRWNIAERTEDGKHNPFLYQMINYFKKISGKAIQIRKREMVPGSFPTSQDTGKIIGIFRKHLDRAAKEAGLE